MAMLNVEHRVGKFSRRNMSHALVRWVQKWPLVTQRSLFQTDCYAGCPCDAYQCEPDKKSLLVLNTRSSNKPVLIKYDGEFRLYFSRIYRNYFKVAKIQTWNLLWGQIHPLIIHAQPQSMTNFMFLVAPGPWNDRYFGVYILIHKQYFSWAK